jgi:hypothetical protein
VKRNDVKVRCVLQSSTVVNRRRSWTCPRATVDDDEGHRSRGRTR